MSKPALMFIKLVPIPFAHDFTLEPAVASAFFSLSNPLSYASEPILILTLDSAICVHLLLFVFFFVKSVFDALQCS